MIHHKVAIFLDYTGEGLEIKVNKWLEDIGGIILEIISIHFGGVQPYTCCIYYKISTQEDVMDDDEDS